MRSPIALLICGALAPASARARDPDLDASNGDLLVALAAVAMLSLCGNMAGGAGGGKRPASDRAAEKAKKAKKAKAAVPAWQPGIASVVAGGVFSYHRQGVSLPCPPPRRPLPPQHDAPHPSAPVTAAEATAAEGSDAEMAQ